MILTNSLLAIGFNALNVSPHRQTPLYKFFALEKRSTSEEVPSPLQIKNKATIDNNSVLFLNSQQY